MSVDMKALPPLPPYVFMEWCLGCGSTYLTCTSLVDLMFFSSTNIFLDIDLLLFCSAFDIGILY